MSAIYRLPLESTDIPMGPFNAAEVAGPPSTLVPTTPVPAMVVMMYYTFEVNGNKQESDEGE